MASRRIAPAARLRRTSLCSIHRRSTSVMKLRSSHTRTLILALFVVLSGATAARSWFFLPSPPRPYIIEGYLDSAPKGATIVDRVEIFTSDRPRRRLLVTSYRAPGEIPLDRYLSWPLLHTYALSGKREDVSRLLDAPAGTEIRGTFLVYTQSYPLLVISELDRPA
jgi:hypothetical protein